MGQWIFKVTLLFLLTSCSFGLMTPTHQLVENAIALQLELTQEQLSQKLDLDLQGFDIKRVSISQEEYLEIQKLPTYHIQGTYDLVFKLPKRSLTQPQKPFDVYLQIQREAKTWRLLLPNQGSKNTQASWRSYLIRVGE